MCYNALTSFRDYVILSSSMVEHTAVNRGVVSSSLTWGATKRFTIFSRTLFCFFMVFTMEYMLFLYMHQRKYYNGITSKKVRGIYV